jgi:hypothetical protein
MYKYEISGANFTDVHITYTNEFNNVQEKKTSFLCREDADSFVKIDMRNWLAGSLKRYVNHASILSAFGWRSFYNSVNRCEALDYCLTIIRLIHEWDLFRISVWINDNEDKLKLILPAPSHNSYKSSEMKLREMVWHSVNIRKHVKEQLAKQQAL